MNDRSAARREQNLAYSPRGTAASKKQMAKHLLHLGFLLAVGALALKAAFMPPRMRATLRPGESAALGDGVLVLKAFDVPKYPSGMPRQCRTRN